MVSSSTHLGSIEEHSLLKTIHAHSRLLHSLAAAARADLDIARIGELLDVMPLDCSEVMGVQMGPERGMRYAGV